MLPRAISLAVAVIVVFAVSLVQSTSAEDYGAAPKDNSFLSDVSLDVELLWISKYIWRGMNLVNGDVIQPSVTVGYKGFSGNLWGSYDLTNDERKRHQLTEWDYTLDYSFGWKKLGFTVGATYYDLRHIHIKDSADAFAIVSVDVPLRPTLAVWKAIKQTEGSYWRFSLSHSFDLPKIADRLEPSLEIEGRVGWGSGRHNETNFGLRRRAFVDAGLYVSLPIKFSKHMAFKPVISYTSILDHRLRERHNHDGNITFGFAWVYSL